MENIFTAEAQRTQRKKYINHRWTQMDTDLSALFFNLCSSVFICGVYSFFLLCAPAQAQETPYADGLYLAYVATGDAALDAGTRAGLENLAEILRRRTAVEPAGVAAVDPARDDLAFFPLLYWAVPENPAPLSGAAAQNVQSWLDHGGTILFDTRDGGSGDDLQAMQSLRVLTSSLNIPPLQPIPEDHVLGRTFYLLRDFYDALWVEGNVSGRDGVSSVIVGSNGWAGEWAQAQGGHIQNRRQEMAMRFGVNLVMYALTGNYKADQVHVPFILERLGR